MFETLDGAATDLGSFQVGNFISGTGTVDGGDLTGVAMLYPPWDDGLGNTYGIIGMNNGVLQFGMSALNGKIYGGSGAVTIDVNGITILFSGSAVNSNMLKWNDASGNMIFYLFSRAGNATTVESNIQTDAPAAGAYTDSDMSIAPRNRSQDNYPQIYMHAPETGNPSFLIAARGRSTGGTIELNAETSIRDAAGSLHTVIDAGDFTGLLTGNGNNVTVAAAGTSYGGFGYFGLNANRANTWVRLPVKIVGGSLSVVTRTAQPGTGTLVITVEDSGNVYGTLTIAAGAAAAAYAAALSTPNVPAGATLHLKIVNNAPATASAQIAGFSLNFTPDV
jgi:hypothetical protein